MRRAIVVGATAMILLTSCTDYQRYKQLETYRVLSLIVGEADRTLDGVAKDKRRTVVQQIINRRAAKGLDAWGNTIRFYERDGGGKYEWAVVSYGSDGEPEVETADAYFTMVAKNIHNKPSSDIVFLNGSPLTEAGK